jgi:ribosomal protein S18 acetylase RimI-like enzyme
MAPGTGIRVSVRKMTEADVEPLARALGWPWYGIDRRWQELVAGYREMFVAAVDSGPVGSVSINEREERPGMLHLFALDVAEGLRCRGIGTRLIARVEEEASKRGLSGVYLEVGMENTGARRLYERLGYEQDGVPFLNSWNSYNAEGNFVEEVVETVCRMVKRLD